ncbi:MAG: presenilin family intramembrane aspartyl protease [Patescibacteria group bacterium]
MIPHNLNLKMFLQELIAFSLIGVISIFSAAKIYSSNFISGTPAPAIFWWQFLLAFGIGTAIVLGLIRIMHGGLFLRLFFLFALFSGTLITTNVFIPYMWALILSLFLIFLYVIWPYVWLHDLVLVVTLPGIAALLGASLNPWTAVLILIIISVYDYVAVYKTKHMVRMAKAMISGRAIFAMIFPEHWQGFKSHLNEVHPEEGFMMLGTGDFVFPLIMAASAYAINPVAAWLIFSFALAGLLLMHLIFVFQKTRRPMPALPPLAAFAILGFLMATIFHF